MYNDNGQQMQDDPMLPDATIHCIARMFVIRGEEYKEPAINVDIENDVKLMSEYATSLFSKLHFIQAKSAMQIDWPDTKKPWVFSGEGIEDNYLMKEKERALAEVNHVPASRIRKFGLVKKFMDIFNKLSEKMPSIAENKNSEVREGLQLPGKWRVIEEWTREVDPYCTFLIYNEVFQRFMIMKTPREGQFKKVEDFIVMVSLWKKISDHPNIPTIHYIEMINERPLIALEYHSTATIEKLVQTNNLFTKANHVINLAIFLKLFLSICDALEYAHDNSVLHLGISPKKVLWTVQDLIETQLYQIPNIKSRSGVLLTEFGSPLLFDMNNQNFNSAHAKAEIEFVDSFWPKQLRRKFKDLIQSQKTSQFPKLHEDFLRSLNAQVDVFLVGGLMLYVINGGKTWNSSDELRSMDVNRLVRNNLDFFHRNIYTRLEEIIQLCLGMADETPEGIENEFSFKTIYDLKKALEMEFGYFRDRVEFLHIVEERPDPSPQTDFPMAEFKRSLSGFYNEWYFGKIQESLVHFKKAKKQVKSLGKGNPLLYDSFNYNCKLFDWLSGKISATKLQQETDKKHSIQLLSGTNTAENLQTSIQLLKTVPDSYFMSYFEKLFNRLVEHYVYEDFNSKKDFLISPEKSIIQNLFVSVDQNLIISTSFSSGIKVFDLEGVLKIKLDIRGISCASATKNLKSVIIGTTTGSVSILQLENIKQLNPESVQSVKQLFKHEGLVNFTEISGNGQIGVSFSSSDQNLVTYDLETFTATEEVLKENLCFFVYDFKGHRSIRCYENSNNPIFSDFMAPIHRRTFEMKAHHHPVTIARLAFDSCSAVTCDLGNKIILWNLQAEKREILGEINCPHLGSILDVRLSALSRFIVVKTTKSITIHEPKLGVIWQEIPCDPLNTALGIDLASPVVEILSDNHVEMYESIVNFKSKKPIWRQDEIYQIAKQSGLKTIKNSASNLSLAPSIDNYRRMAHTLQVMNRRKQSSKKFFNTFDMANPYKLFIIYGKNINGQRVVIEEYPLEFSLDFKIDLYSNNQQSFLYSSSFKAPFTIPEGAPKLSIYSQFLAYFLNTEDYKHLHLMKEYQNANVRVPQHFFLYKSLTLRRGEAQTGEYKAGLVFDKICDKVENDVIQLSYLTPNGAYLLVGTSQNFAICYSIPSYSTKFLMELTLTNPQIGRIMRIFEEQGQDFDVETSCNTFSMTWVSAVATNSTASILAVGFIDGYLNVFDTSTKSLMHIVQAHVDYFQCMIFTFRDILVTGGIDSNIKVWRSLNDPVLSTESIFFKHTDKIIKLKCFMVERCEYILSCASDGTAYYWGIGVYRPDKQLSFGDAQMVDGTLSFLYKLTLEGSSVAMEKYSFSTRTMVRKRIVRYFEGLSEFDVRALLGFTDSEIFVPKTRGVFQMCKNLIIVWIGGGTEPIEFYETENLTKVFEVNLAENPLFVTISHNMNDLHLYYNYNLHVLRLLDLRPERRPALKDVADVKALKLEQKGMSQSSKRTL